MGAAVGELSTISNQVGSKLGTFTYLTDERFINCLPSTQRQYAGRWAVGQGEKPEDILRTFEAFVVIREANFDLVIPITAQKL
jgi:hypothetical protein